MLGWVAKHFLSFFAVLTKIRVSKDEQTKRKTRKCTQTFGETCTVKQL